MIEIRQAVKDDIQSILLLWEEMWQMHMKLDPRYQMTEMTKLSMRYWLDTNIASQQSQVLVANDDNLPVGYILSMIIENPLMMPDQFSGYISEVAVTKSFQRKGVGKKLLEEAHKWFKQNNIRFVDVNVSEFNDVSVNFWKKNGYKDFIKRLRIQLT